MPICNPRTVTLIADVAATFVGITLLGPGPSNVIDAVSVLIFQPVVIANRRSVQMPAVERVQTQLSDTHVVASLRVPPMRDGEL